MTGLRYGLGAVLLFGAMSGLSGCASNDYAEMNGPPPVEYYVPRAHHRPVYHPTIVHPVARAAPAPASDPGIIYPPQFGVTTGGNAGGNGGSPGGSSGGWH